MNTVPTLHPSAPGHTTTTAAPGTGPRRYVTDVPTRMFHWLFAFSFVGAYLTAESEHWRLLHVTLGYSFAGLLVFRLVYGLIGPRQVKLNLLWRKLSAAPAWFRQLRAQPSLGSLSGRPAQNLGMALAIVLMLALVIPLTLTGYATYNDWGDAFGAEVLEELHDFFGNAFLLVVLAHVGLIALLSVLRRQNVARSMLSGRIDGQGPSPVAHNRTWLAVLMLLVFIAFGAWQWQSAPPGSLLQTDTQQMDDGDHDEDDD